MFVCLLLDVLNQSSVLPSLWRSINLVSFVKVKVPEAI